MTNDAAFQSAERAVHEQTTSPFTYFLYLSYNQDETLLGHRNDSFVFIPQNCIFVAREKDQEATAAFVVCNSFIGPSIETNHTYTTNQICDTFGALLF